MQHHISKLEKPLISLSQVLSNNRILMSIKDAFIVSIPFTVIGSFSALIKGQLDYFWKGNENGLYTVLAESLSYINATSLGLIGLIILLSSAFFYAKHLSVSNTKLTPLRATLVALVAYMVTIPNSIQLPSMESVSGYQLQFFNYEGMFSGLIIGLIATHLFHLLLKSKWTIKLHESVPPAIMETFMSMIPIAGVMMLFTLVRQGISSLGFAHMHEFIQQIIVSPLNSIGTGLPAVIIVVLLMQLLWFFGLHGFSIMWGVASPIWLPLFLSHVDIFNQTQSYELITQVAPHTLATIYAMIGGSGSTLALILVLLALAPKNSSERSVAKISSVPGLFNINEPVIFGLPIVLNPIMFIPFVFIPLVNVVIAYFAVSTGLVAPLVVLTSGVEPIFINAFIGGNFALSPVLLLLALFVIDAILYAPFVKVLLKQRAKMAEEEQQVPFETATQN